MYNKVNQLYIYIFIFFRFLDHFSCRLLLLLKHFSRVWLCATPETAAYPAPRPWDSSGENTGVGCHFLLQCMKVKSEREVAQSYPTLSDPMDCSLWGSFLHRIFQARVLEWGAIAFSAWCSIDRYIQRCLGLKHYYTCKLHSKDFGGKIHAVCAYVYM